MKSIGIALTLIAALAAPAAARTRIAELGTAPLLGMQTSTTQLKSTVSAKTALLAQAGSKLGLSPAEFRAFRQAVADGKLTWVTVPRKLDAMTWSSGGRVYVLKDVTIPAGTTGWEVDLPGNGASLALFMPARCGNLSIVRRPLPVIARRGAANNAVAYEKPAAPAPALEAPSPAAPEAAPEVQAQPAVIGAELPPSPKAARIGVLPLIAGAILSVLGGGGGGLPGVSAPPPPPGLATCPLAQK